MLTVDIRNSQGTIILSFVLTPNQPAGWSAGVEGGVIDNGYHYTDFVIKNQAHPVSQDREFAEALKESMREFEAQQVVKSAKERETLTPSEWLESMRKKENPDNAGAVSADFDADAPPAPDVECPLLNADGKQIGKATNFVWRNGRLYATLHLRPDDAPPAPDLTLDRPG